ncbi:hypothetical protein ACYT84_07220 [Ralstonia solanacearum]|uniref:hypothetical protein n=1 Tax=Ralstonia solanacearum TaxID=305 RepID=UPI0018D0B630|nr:hypothetical protein [Ralstonia solanacearum]
MKTISEKPNPKFLVLMEVVIQVSISKKMGKRQIELHGTFLHAQENEKFRESCFANSKNSRGTEM